MRFGSRRRRTLALLRRSIETLSVGARLRVSVDVGHQRWRLP